MNNFRLEPVVGEVKRACEIGHKGKMWYIWVICPNCGKGRWTEKVNLSRANYTGLCCHCNLAHNIRRTLFGKNHPNWKGGRQKRKEGYILIRADPDDFFYRMADKSGYILEHRLVMAKHLHRCLLPWEVVHHKGTKYPQGSIDDKSDNRIENLELFPSQKQHVPSARWQQELRKRDRRIEQLEKRVTLLEAENALLRVEGVSHE